MKVDLHYLFTAKYARWIIGSSLAFFSLLIIGEYGSLFWYPSVREVPASPVDLTNKPKPDFSKFAIQSSLFGVYKPNGTGDGGVRRSMLNMTVVGVLFAGEEKDSQVILSAQGGEEKTYKIGDTLPGNVKIKGITADGVLLEREGHLESLSLPKSELHFEPAPMPLKEEQLP